MERRRVMEKNREARCSDPCTCPDLVRDGQSQVRSLPVPFTARVI